MNKRELIETLEEIKENSRRSIKIDKHEDYWRGKTEAYVNLIGLAKQLDEPQQLIMPKFFDDWAKQVIAERDKFYAISLIARVGWGYGVDYELSENRSPSERKKLANWLVEGSVGDYPNKKKATEALLYGYEVEKEPLYVIKKDNDYITYVSLGKKSYERNYTKNKKEAIRLKKEDAEALSVVFGGEVTEG
ncbi:MULTISPECIES: DUF1642 domain-containing protein [unclassified Enterococcus]|uniref:DUF1642 domain-containing protein n=1 Tax=unclassified Enterococcus TaxID=2608891 RepID=UPI0013EAF463|nr:MULTISPECIES: DUF1642 domain-containing protein [unclassified Enterococcus]